MKLVKRIPLLIVALLVLLAINSFAQKPSNMKYSTLLYEKEWKEIETLKNKRLPKSALKEVDALYLKATKDNNPAQIIKTLSYKVTLQSELNEDGFEKAIYDLESKMKASEAPVKPILQSILAETYANYLSNNYWRFSDRTHTVDYQSEDIQTWSLEQLTQRMLELYIASTQFEITKTIDINIFDGITAKGNMDRERPLLYDFLVHRAIDQLMNSQSYLSSPSYKFEIRDAVALGKTDEFTTTKFSTKDKNSFKYQALILFQKVLDFHAKDKNPSAKIDADLKRISFIFNTIIHDQKDSLYLATLSSMVQQYEGLPVAAEIEYKIAAYYEQQGNQYQPKSKEENQWELKKAWGIAQRVIKEYPSTYGAQQCLSLMNRIERKELRFNTELVVLPKQASLAYFSYKNIDEVFIRVVRISDKEYFDLQQNNYQKNLSFLKSKPIIYSKVAQLPNLGDFQSHSTEVMIDKLPLGQYVIYISNKAGFKFEEAIIQYTKLTVSNIGYFQRKDETGKVNFALVGRNDGAPLEGVTAHFSERKYNNKKRKYELKPLKSLKSGTDGFIRTTFGHRKQFTVSFSKGQDHLNLNDNYSNPKPYDNARADSKVHFFTDRAIYRPGQQLFFKGIAIETDTDQRPHILLNKKIEITLFDVNGQEVISEFFRTNEYGTFNGVFTLPDTGLKGRFRLSADLGYSNTYFRVEEYKRPKFSVNMQPLEGDFTLEDLVTATGEAKAYAGNAIDGAKVKYRVVRQVSFPWWPWWYRRPAWTGKTSMEITNGETETKADGTFNIEFEAIPDRSIGKDKNPLFRYTVYADVVDVTGETHSTSRTFSFGYLSLMAKVNLAENIDKAEKELTASIQTTNLNGVFQAAEGTIEVVQLKIPEKSFIDRFWAVPDLYYLKRHKYKKHFPNYAYNDENLVQNWETLSTIINQSFNTADTNNIVLDIRDWAVGQYQIKLTTKDKSGTLIEDQKYFTISDLEQQKLPQNQMLFHEFDQVKYKVNEKVTLQLGAPKEKLHILYEIQGKTNILQSKWLTVNNWESTEFITTEKDRSNTVVTLAYMKHNRAFLINKPVPIPWDDKKLEIEYAVFRDKLKPGAEEEWQIKIKGPNGTMAAAEVLASMYDASLDQFASHNWFLSLYHTSGYPKFSWRAKGFQSTYPNHLSWTSHPDISINRRIYRSLIPLISLGFGGGAYYSADAYEVKSAPMNKSAKRVQPLSPGIVMEDDAVSVRGSRSAETTYMMDGVEVSKNEAPPGSPVLQENDQTADPAPIKVRTNFNETVFFMPDLRTDKDGNIIIKFTMSEALTKWKLMTFAHTTDLKTAISTKELVTQKELMIQANPPRFLREGDVIEFTAKVSNLSGGALDGSATLALFDALTMKPIDGLLENNNAAISFEMEKGRSQGLSWKIKIPKGKVMAVTHRVTARAHKFTDGEENTLPVLTNRMLVTETMPMTIRAGKSKTFNFKHFQKVGQSPTLQNHNYTLEFTSNPAWYAVKSLPYLMEYPYDCTEQIFSRYYANSLASSVANQYPSIRQVLDQWKGTDALDAELTKNEALKSALLKETPWVIEAQSEAQQRKNIGLLFDLNKLAREEKKTLMKLKERQSSSGGFAWFPGGRDSWYITQYLVEGFGHMKQLGVKSIQQDNDTQRLLQKAVQYIDEEVKRHYEKLAKQVKLGHTDFQKDHLDNMVIHYLYARSFFIEQPFSNKKVEQVLDYYLGQADSYWTNKGLYQQGLLALALHRYKKTKTTNGMMASFKERALHSEALGMYWKYNSGYYWYQLPIETHSLMIEVFSELTNDVDAIDEMRLWLLKNKETTHWKTTKATAAAIYALLMNGTDWLPESQDLKITLPKAKAQEQVLRDAQQTVEAGSGYFKASWKGEQVNTDLATIKIKNPNKIVAWGSAYWQYFEDLDKIDFFEDTPLQLKKQLFKEVPSSTGPVLTKVDKNTVLIPGDKLKVRIELRVDRVMEYIHMKDMRASGFEPINVLSQYKWQGGLGYYESTSDTATDFFFSYLPKGTYVFEYPIRVIHKGDFSNGITTIQCMYAPAYTSHSEGVRVKVD